MKPNVGTADAFIRWVVAAALFIVAVTVTSLAVSTVAALGALVMAGTAFTHRCPLYKVLGINTCGSGTAAGAR